MTHLTIHHIEHLIWHLSRLSRSLAVIHPDNSPACRLIDEAEQRLLKATEMLQASITCIGCGCSEHASCATADGWGCYWLIVDYGKKQGICSECSQIFSRDIRERREKIHRKSQ